MAECEELSIVREFEEWISKTPGEHIFLLETRKDETSGAIVLSLILAGEHEFQIHCFPGGRFLFEANGIVKQWAEDVNRMLSSSFTTLTFFDILTSAIALYSSNINSASEAKMEVSVESDEEDEEEMTEQVDASGDLDDENFTTEWELEVARKKKRWMLREQEIRKELKHQNKRSCPSATQGVKCSVQIREMEKKQASQVFTSSGATGVLMNDLIQIMIHEQEYGLKAEPIDNNIYLWQVKLSDFDSGSDLANDLSVVGDRFGYDYIELQLEFAMDLYPFFPPMVKVVRPLMQGSLMQRITNMEMLKLSHWNPAKDMLGVLIEIKEVLQRWARLDVMSVRNDRKYRNGSYLDIENYLLKLAMVSEGIPRANSKYTLPSDIVVTKAPAVKQSKAVEKEEKKASKSSREYWAPGTGYGHSQRPGWDVNAYLAAQKEKDKQLVLVLHDILDELVKLYAHHAPQLQPRPSASAAAAQAAAQASALAAAQGSSAGTSAAAAAADGADDIISPIEHMFDILEGSALVPLLESYMKVDSFLEIARHTEVYKVIIQIIKEIAFQPGLLPLIGKLQLQDKSLYELLINIDSKASVFLRHVFKAGNGVIPKPPSSSSSPSPSSNSRHNNHTGSSGKESSSHHHHHHKSEHRHKHSSASAHNSDTYGEERLARDFQQLVKDIQTACQRAGITEEVLMHGSPLNNHVGLTAGASAADTASSSSCSSGASISASSSNGPIANSNSDLTMSDSLGTGYIEAVRPLQYASCDIDVDGPFAHYFTKEFNKQSTPSKELVLRIAQEMTSLSTSLPLGLASSIFVRVDEEKSTLMRALITGPEGTPYSGGCYIFDIFFSSHYPSTPPKVNLCTTGGGTVRFNPNLYNCGKVCLSLLGTWEGQEGEQWNDKTSTLLQVLVSIQSLILVPDPFFNEPGYEHWIGSEYGNQQSTQYNQDLQLYSVKYAMIDQLRNPCPEFEDVIRAHFYMKKDRILEEVQSWLKPGRKDQLEKTIETLKREFSKLKPPSKSS